jgi:hypothetical protein
MDAEAEYFNIYTARWIPKDFKEVLKMGDVLAALGIRFCNRLIF